jgi:ATP-binding cassette, subfamily C, bacterial LapB
MKNAFSQATYLLPCLARLAQLQHEVVDRLALQEAAEAVLPDANVHAQLNTVASHLGVRAPRWIAKPDAASLPVLVFAQEGELSGQWGVLRAQNAQGQWVSEWWDATAQRWREQADRSLAQHTLAHFKLSPPFTTSTSPVYQLIRQEVLGQKKTLRDIVMGGLMINVIALAASFYSMHVYDRVVPTGAAQTLLVLTLGVLLAVVFELVTRRVRSRLYERLIYQIDQRLARTVFMRFLAIRMDQMPHSVGALAAQMRGYETVRSFFTSMTTNLLIDAPFALLFVGIIGFIAGPLALIPALFLVLSLAFGWYQRAQVEACAKDAMQANNHKTGLLVEAVEGAEIIKSGQGGWRMLSRWMKTTDQARDNEMQMRTLTEHTQHLTAAFQQFSYILLVASGALLISRGELTMGGLIACSILSGRVLAPIATIPSQLVLWAHTKAALQGLDRLWALKDDHHGQEQAVVLDNIQGHYRIESVALNYGGNKALSIAQLNIQPGEKIGVLGPVGAGKTSLLRLLSGMYKPQEGRVLLDDIDLAHIAKPALAERVGYVAQDGRLFSGTLRDNLILGLIDPGDDAILAAARTTGLLQAVIAQNPKGLAQTIHEGGTGLSGGQRQLLNLTRAFLRQPRIWLLDEPTASMDRSLEIKITQALKAVFRPEDTVVLVTHKAEMLELVDRLIVIADHRIQLDGPKLDVLQRLQNPTPSAELKPELIAA